MPAPLIPIVVAVVAGLLGLMTGLKWKAIVRALKGQKIAILGQTQVGKTTLHAFLSEGVLPEKYEETIGRIKTSGRTFELKDLKLQIKQGKDVGGRQSLTGPWKKTVEESDRVFYLVRADLLLAGDPATEARVERDTLNIRAWLTDESKGSDKGLKKPVAIIGTHADLHPGFSSLSGDKAREFEEAFAALRPVRQMMIRCGGGNHVPVVVGSLKSSDDAQRLVYVLFKNLEALK